MMRNEKLHKNLHNNYVPTIDETIKMIDMWLNFKNSQPCPNAPDKTIAEVLENRTRQNINIDTLDDLMLATEIKTIQRNGIRFLNCDYFDERLYGFKSKVLIKYNLFDLRSITVFTTKGEFLCTAERVTETHPMAEILGTVTDFEDYKQKIKNQQKLHRKTINSVKQFLPQEEVLTISKSLQTIGDYSDIVRPFFSKSKISEKEGKFIETEMVKDEPPRPLRERVGVRGINGRPLFKNNAEKYEYLVKNDPNNTWIADFKKTKEYKLLYE